jgi:hypothetical protein
MRTRRRGVFTSSGGTREDSLEGVSRFSFIPVHPHKDGIGYGLSVTRFVVALFKSERRIFTDPRLVKD